MQDKGFVLSRWSRSCVVATLCAGLFAGCVGDGGGESPVPGDGARPASTSKALTTLPPRVGLTLQDIQDAGSNLPYCRLLRTYLTPQVLQAYYSDQGFDGCVVAWIGDTGESVEVNSNYAEDVYRVYVKRAGPELQTTVFHMLGDGVGPVDVRLGGPPLSAVSTFTLALDARGYPIVAWLKRTTVHLPNVVLRAARWDGQRWLPMGDELNEVDSPDSVAFNPQLSWSAEDRPVLTWDESVNGGTLHVQRTWDGSIWK
ncbi:hypothetical protein [Myxococcus qinghaiensis]|uniref:hypothetical protein n=1 Tax=Myxococcus qinghaiensis TaxID=2906758 RepID=UPI0020A7C9F9|nr:hypothetical protein [Myxococcus qinghaiensis]MCP3166728.1 hypothetical protein [Myxococcus qinghaiensis]